MQKLTFVFTIIFVNITLLSFAQDISNKNQRIKEEKSGVLKENQINSPEATGDDVKIKDDEDNTLLRVIDEGSFGSIELQNGVPTTTTNKLYNNSGTLNFNGTSLGSGGVSAIDDLTDAIYDGSSLFLGAGAGVNDNGTSNFNTAVGNNALNNSTTAVNNTAIGAGALFTNNGSNNTANGNAALYFNSAGYNNTAVGFTALENNTTGNYNTANGCGALKDNTTGTNNTANGTGALEYNMTGTHNTANGFAALWSNKTGSSNIAIGTMALFHNTSKSRLVAVGDSALFNNDTDAIEDIHATNNTAVGSKTLFSNTIGYENTANGAWSLNKNTTGNSNIGNGTGALYSNTTGSYNTGNGTGALYYNTEGDYNTAVGYIAGPTANNLENTTALGYSAIPTASNQVKIGNSSITSIGGAVSWSIISDGRYKRNIREDVAGIDFIMSLRPITYNLDVELISSKLQEDMVIDENGNKIRAEASAEIVAFRSKKASLRNTGFIAQEVEELANSLGFDFSGVDAPENEESVYSLRYAEFVVPIVKAIQEQQEVIEELRKEIEELKRR